MASRASFSNQSLPVQSSILEKTIIGDTILKSPVPEPFIASSVQLNSYQSVLEKLVSDSKLQEQDWIELLYSGKFELPSTT